MKIQLKFSLSQLPFYILTISLFLGNFIIQYIALLIFLFLYLLRSRLKIRLDKFFWLASLLILVAILSYFYNLFTGLADKYTLLFWFFSYLPPFVLIALIQTYPASIDYEKLYNFYKTLVYIQSFLIIYAAFKYKTFIVGDNARGTVGDGNWVAFHIGVVLIYEIIKLIENTRYSQIDSSYNLKKTAEIIYFLVVFLIPESTANLGFLIIILGLIFIKEYILSKISLKNFFIFLFCSLAAIFFISKTFVYERIDNAIKDLRESEINKNPYLSKVNIYRKVFNGEIYKDSNWFIGSGPATFTSRSSVMRMPDERVNDFPVKLPYFKSRLFKKYISPIYANWRLTKESYGNFASPQTTFISVAVELGILGIVLFMLFFYYIFKTTDLIKLPPNGNYLKKFIKYFSIFFILSLFHLNFWEYPIMTFTYIIFVFSIITHKETVFHKQLS